MKLTIKEIAEAAGVSKATVSRVLNDSNAVSEETRKKVLEIIKETNFRPNSVARSLSLKKSHLIGIILPDLSNPVFSKIIAGAESYIRNKDYSLLITATDFDIDMKIEHINIMKDKGVDGLILVTDHGSEEFHKTLVEFEKPIIMIGSDSSLPSIPTIKIDNYKASQDAVQYLIDIGHKKIGMIRGPLSDYHSGKQRFLGYRDKLNCYGYYSEEFVKEGWYTFDDGYSAMESFIKKGHLPTAIFCASDLLAIGAIKCCIENGINVPDEISFVGFDDVDIARMYNPSLTTIRQPFEEQGDLAIRIMIDMIENKSIIPDDEDNRFTTSMKYQLIIRESTKNIK